MPHNGRVTGDGATDGRTGDGQLAVTPSRYTFDDNIDPSSSHGIMLALVGRDRDVLDIGCAAGDLARALSRQGCRVSGVEVDEVAAQAARPHLEHLVVGDLETIDLIASQRGRRYDTVVFGDVLEHLRDPLHVLRQVPALLVPGGSIVVSIPNVAHASVQISLLQGEFRYRSKGLLDETHLRFFTRKSVMELLAAAGFIPVDDRRTVLGPFDSEIDVDAELIAPEILTAIMRNPDAITYQFVVEAVVDDAEGRVRARMEQATRTERELKTARVRIAELQQQSEQSDNRARVLRERYLRAEEQLRQQRQTTERALAEREAEASQVLEARRTAELAQVEAATARAALSAVHNSTAWRVSAPVRALGPLRAALQGRPRGRRGLRRRGAVSAAARSLHAHGFRGTLERVRNELGCDPRRQMYADWINQWDTLTNTDLRLIDEHIRRDLSEGPLVSVIVPVYETDPELLRATVGSVQAQLYSHWELCLVDDASTSASTYQALQQLAELDPRIRVERRSRNGGIAATTNHALAMATGDLVAFLDHDDVLAPHALYLVVAELLNHAEAELIYSDEDKLDADGSRYDPHFKPDFDPELLLGQNYLSHLTVMRRTLVERLGGLNEGLDGSQDHDLVLRATEILRPEQVRHLPFVLYHWRQWSGSGTFSSRRMHESATSSRAAVEAHLARRGEAGARVVSCPAQPGWNRVLRSVSVPPPGVTAVIPTRDQLSLLQGCVEGLLYDTDYAALQLLVVDNDSSDPATLDYLRDIRQNPRVQVMPASGPFNYSRINNQAVAQVATPLTLLLNNDILVREQDWLAEMVALLQVPGTGAVGAKLLYSDGRVQHAGVILGIGGVAGHSHKYLPGASTGYFGRLVLNQHVSAATAACLLLPTQLYRDVGGLNETDLAIAFNDVDLCLRIGEAGRRIAYAANAVLYHLESASRGAEATDAQVARFNAEADWMRERWAHRLYRDPAYNPNLTDMHEDFGLAEVPRVSRPWQQ